MIDGITFYERLNRRPDFVKAMTELLHIMDDCKNITMRMMLTCHRRSAFVKDLIDDWQFPPTSMETVRDGAGMAGIEA